MRRARSRFISEANGCHGDENRPFKPTCNPRANRAWSLESSLPRVIKPVKEYCSAKLDYLQASKEGTKGNRPQVGSKYPFVMLLKFWKFLRHV